MAKNPYTPDLSHGNILPHFKTREVFNMRKILFLLAFVAVLIPGLVSAQTARDIQVDFAWTAPAAGENITKYNCIYRLKENGVETAFACHMDPWNGVASLTVNLVQTTADQINVQLEACNPDGCSGYQQPTAYLDLPPAFDPPTVPTGTSVSATRLP